MIKMRMRTIVLSATFAVVDVTPSSPVFAQGPTGQGPGQLVDEAWQVINRDFVDPTYHHHDWPRTRRELLSKKYGSTKEAHLAIVRMLRELDDPQTRLMSPTDLASTIQELTGELADIGVVDPWVMQDEKTGELQLLHLIADSPALKADLRPHDVIETIDGVPAATLSRDEAFARIRGKAGTLVRLTVRRRNASFDLSLTREMLTQRTVVRTSATNKEGCILGYIALSQFAVHSGEEVRNAINDLLNRKAEGFVLDLRNNPGGFVPASREIASLFLGQKPLYSTLDRTGASLEIVGTGSPLTDKPMVVLVNDATASAGEILAGALKDNHRAVLVGSKTFGQGLVHSVRTLSDGSGLVVAIAHFKTPAGHEVHRKGIEPDLTVDAPRQLLTPSEVATPKDLQYEKAVETLLQRVNS
jgi:carboxyl-terminal processing protease